MFCPMCQQEVGNEDSLQLHYLSCPAYSALESANPPSETILVKFRWIKAKPCFEEQVHLISSLADSIPLSWSEDEGLYQSELTSVPLGEHNCQLVVGGDVIPTEEVIVNRDSDVIYIIIKEDPQSQSVSKLLADYLTSSAEAAEDAADDGTEPLGGITSSSTSSTTTVTTTTTTTTVDDIFDDETTVIPRANGSHFGELSPLYQEMIRHQVQHGEPSWVPTVDTWNLDSPSDLARPLERNSSISDISETELMIGTRPEVVGVSSQTRQGSSEASADDRSSPPPSSSVSRHSSAIATPSSSPPTVSPVASVDILPEPSTQPQTTTHSVDEYSNQAAPSTTTLAPQVTDERQETVDGETVTRIPRDSPTGLESALSDRETVSTTKEPSPSQNHSGLGSEGAISSRVPRSDAAGGDLAKRSTPEPSHTRSDTPGSLELENIGSTFATDVATEHPVIRSPHRPASSSTRSEQSESSVLRGAVYKEPERHSSVTPSPVQSSSCSETSRRRSSDPSRKTAMTSPHIGSEVSYSMRRRGSCPTSLTHSSGERKTSQPGETSLRSAGGVSQRTFPLHSLRTDLPTSMFTGAGQSSPGHSPVLSGRRASPTDTSHGKPLVAPQNVFSIPSDNSAFQTATSERQVHETQPGEVEALKRERDELLHQLDQTKAYYELKQAALDGKNKDLQQQVLSLQTVNRELRTLETRLSEAEALKRETDELLRQLDHTKSYYEAKLAASDEKNKDLQRQLSSLQTANGECRVSKTRLGEVEALMQERNDLLHQLDQTKSFYKKKLSVSDEKNKDLQQQLLSLRTAEGLSLKDLEDMRELEQNLAVLKDKLSRREVEVDTLRREVRKLQESNRHLEEDQESIRTVHQIQMDELKDTNRFLESKGSKFEKGLRERIKMLEDDAVRLQLDKTELQRQLTNMKLAKMSAEAKLTRAKSETELSFNRLLGHDSSRFKDDERSRYSPNYLADSNRHVTSKYGESYSSPYLRANDFSAYRESSVANSELLNGELQTRRAIHAGTSYDHVKYDRDFYKTDSTPRSARRRHVSLGDSYDATELTNYRHQKGHNETSLLRQTDGDFKSRYRPHSYGGSSPILDYTKRDLHQRSVSLSPPSNNSTFTSSYTSDSSDAMTASYKTKSPSTVTPSSCTKAFAPKSPDDIHVGMRVMVMRSRGKAGRGMVRYIGALPGLKGTYLGVELDTNDGKHDGSFNDHRFFTCKPNKGVFVPFNKVVMCSG